MKDNVLREKSFKFAVRAVKLSQFLVNEKKEYILSKQILKSGTSIGANIEEALGGISDADFSAKMSISYKESRETNYWIRLLFETNFISKEEYESLFHDCDELCKILFSIIKTMRIEK